MPRIQRNPNAAIIEVSIPVRLSHDAGDLDDDDPCFICAHAYCTNDACKHTVTRLRCCSKVVCCGCISKLAMRCTCDDECEKIIAMCPFCRAIARLEALEIFLASRPVCKECTVDDGPARGNGELPAPPAPSPAPSLAASVA